MVRVVGLLWVCLLWVCLCVSPLASGAEALRPGGSAGQVITGSVTVVDGDSLRLGDVRIRLHGIDSLEHDQKCGGRGIGVWDCGAWVTGQVTARYGGRTARCEARDVDRYGRIVARCTVGGEDIAAYLVGEGLAFAYRRYSMDYDLLEKGAVVSGKGLHNVDFVLPARFRALRRAERVARARAKAAEASANVPIGCRIKGNVSHASGERIYHVPGQRDYAATIITEARGERWFCSEGDARAAGWRRALR